MSRPHQPSRLAVLQQCILARFGTMTFDTWDMLTANYDELLHPYDAVTASPVSIGRRRMTFSLQLLD